MTSQMLLGSVDSMKQVEVGSIRPELCCTTPNLDPLPYSQGEMMLYSHR